MDWTLTLVSCDYFCSMHHTCVRKQWLTYVAACLCLLCTSCACFLCVRMRTFFCMVYVSWSCPKGLALQQLFDTLQSLLNLILCFSHIVKHHMSFLLFPTDWSSLNLGYWCNSWFWKVVVCTLQNCIAPSWRKWGIQSFWVDVTITTGSILLKLGNGWVFCSIFEISLGHSLFQLKFSAYHCCSKNNIL